MKKRFRHVLFAILFRPLFRIGLWIRYRYWAKIYKNKAVKGPYLILGNHTMNMDPFFVSLSFKEPIYYVASDMLFAIPSCQKSFLIWYNQSQNPNIKQIQKPLKNMIKVARSGVVLLGYSRKAIVRLVGK